MKWLKRLFAPRAWVTIYIYEVEYQPSHLVAYFKATREQQEVSGCVVVMEKDTVAVVARKAESMARQLLAFDQFYSDMPKALEGRSWRTKQ